MSRQTVSHYGLHQDNKGTFWLEQGPEGANVLGLKERSPFQVSLPTRSQHCNHAIHPHDRVPHDDHWSFLAQHISDPLLQAILPVDQSRAQPAFVPDPTGGLTLPLAILSRMSSPIRPSVVPIRALSVTGIAEAAYQTNLQPLILTGCTRDHAPQMLEAVEMSADLPRPLIFSGEPGIETDLDLRRLPARKLADLTTDLPRFAALPWERLGAAVIRRYMRDEWPIRVGERKYRRETVAR